MDRYIGLDVHAQSTTVAVVSGGGRRLKSWVVETHGETLVDAIRGIAGSRHVHLEEGTQSAWIYELLSPHTAEVVVSVPPKRRGSKSDERDAWKLGDDLRVGTIDRCVYKPAHHFTGLRNAMRAHSFAVQNLVRAKNRLRAVFRSRGIAVDASVYAAARRIESLAKLPDSQRRLASCLAEQVDELEEHRSVAEKWLLEEASMHPITRKLRTTPGMGPIRTAQLVAIVVDPYRFRTRRQFWSYCGLGIVTRSTSDWTLGSAGWVRARVAQTRGLNRQRHPLLKSLFKGAATCVIHQLPDHPLQQAYQRRLAAGIRPNLAKLTLARSIAAIVLSMWKHKEVYDPKRHLTPTTDTAH
jgi:transposase